MPLLNVLNRYSEPVEIQFDAAFNTDSPYRWAPGEVKVLMQEVAMFCRRKSIIRSDPITGKDVRALLVQGIDKEYDTYAAPEGAVPALLTHRGPELLDRANMAARDQEITFLSLANPKDRAAVATESHSRRA